MREVVDRDQEYTTKNPLNNTANGNGGESGSDNEEGKDQVNNNRGRE